MAVQAQYPSNVLFLNRNVVQEGNDYSSLQPQQRGIHDQSQLLFNNNTGVETKNQQQRKRGREDNVTATTNTTPINSFVSMQTQNNHPRLIDLTQLHNQQPNVVSTGLRLAFEDQQQLQLSNRQKQIQQEHTLSPQSSSLLSLLSQDFRAQINQQNDEIEQFLQAQGEQLRRTLAEKRQRHYCALVGAAEESASRRVREKEAEVEKAARRNAELEARAAQLRAEAQVWQARARAQEATAAALQAQLQQAIMSGGCAREEGEEGGVGCTTGEGGGADDAESAYVDPERIVLETAARGKSCRACWKRVASVVVLPCRHLSVCRECDGVVEACPVCLSYRSSSVEVFLS